ncbi:MAG: UDP-forming cellulose synthase catalytic subunit [Verrucomicrobia bacterium]|nr:UDP-forming cellulose synthase catalytic subunit [Verrucomicrobiota bacterium]
MSTAQLSIQRTHTAGPKSRGLPLLCLLWFMAAAGLGYLSSAQVDAHAQVCFSIGLLALLFAFKRARNDRRLSRIFFLAIATFVVLRYFFWRTLYTLEFTDWLSFTCALILYGAELYGIIVFLIGNFINISPITREPVPLPPPEGLPTVDVFIPSYNESPAILEATLLSALQMRYPQDKRKIYLCDDGGTDQKCQSGSEESKMAARKRRRELTALCETLGAHYLTRPANRGAKAGNLNEAFKRTGGDLVVIFDADHMPTVDFLEKTVGLFTQDEKLFLVQTPHFFVNPDPVEKNLGTFFQMPSENEMFYRAIQKGLDFWNAAFFCGSGAVMRRRHLEITGGLSGDTITEDAETALTLHAKGYNSAYISTPLLSGFAPETMGAFIKQRIRWAQGMVQILLLKCPLLIRGLTLPQRLCYFNSCIFWFFPFARLTYLLAPTALLFFGLRIYAANWQTFATYVIPYVVTVLSVSHYLYGKFRWAFMSELYELLQSVYTVPAIFSTILNPRAPTFNVTPKGETLSRNFISPLATPFYVLALINFGTVAAGIYRLMQLQNRDDIYPVAITLFWSGLNTIMLLAVLGALLEQRQRRVTPRMPAMINATLLIDELELPCRVGDLSLGGCKMVFKGLSERTFHKPGRTQLRIRIDDEESEQLLNLQLRNLRLEDHSGEIIVGAEFAHQSLEETRAKVRLVSGSRQRWVEFQKRRESRLGVLGCFISFTYIGVRNSALHLSHLITHAGDSVTGRGRVLETQSFEN